LNNVQLYIASASTVMVLVDILNQRSLIVWRANREPHDNWNRMDRLAHVWTGLNGLREFFRTLASMMRGSTIWKAQRMTILWLRD